MGFMGFGKGDDGSTTGQERSEILAAARFLIDNNDNGDLQFQFLTTLTEKQRFYVMACLLGEIHRLKREAQAN